MRNPEFEALLDMSARVGANPALVQGPRGNTSIKEAGTLWIKGSGCWLMHARQRDMMVPVDLDSLLGAFERDDPACEDARPFVIAKKNPFGLRPSLETAAHALLPAKVVAHVHCVETLAMAVRADAEAMVAERLRAIPHAFIPYVRPGLPLAREIAKRVRSGISVVVLGNHGLIVAAETVARTSALLIKVSGALRSVPRFGPSADYPALVRLSQGSEMQIADDPRLHNLATDRASQEIIKGGRLYPDQVLFLGDDLIIASATEPALELQQACEKAGLGEPAVIVYPGKGVLINRNIGFRAMAALGCLASVVARIPAEAKLRYLTSRESGELLQWNMKLQMTDDLRSMGAMTSVRH